MRPSPTPTRLTPLLAIALALAACGEDLDPASLLRDARVLALVAEPLELGPDDAVVIHPALWLPPGDAVATHAWSFCPFTLGAASGYRCALPACEVALASDAEGAVTASPRALAEQCLAAVEGAPVQGVPDELPERVELAFRYRLVSAAGTVREALALIPFFVAGAPAERNTPPAILGVELGGVPVAPGEAGPPLRAGGELELRVRLDPASAQTFTDALGRAARESLVVSFFTTAGELDADRADGPDARQTLKGDALGDASEAQVWVVARDLRGGQTVAGPYRVPLQR